MSAWNPQKQGLGKWQCSLHDAIVILPGPEFPSLLPWKWPQGQGKCQPFPYLTGVPQTCMSTAWMLSGWLSIPALQKSALKHHQFYCAPGWG